MTTTVITATPMATLAIQWVLANPVITAPIIGASRPEQLSASLAAIDEPLDPEIKRRLERGRLRERQAGQAVGRRPHHF